MDRLSNPYRPGAGTEPPAMLGRDDLIDAFGVTVRRALDGRPGKSYMPIGLRTAFSVPLFDDYLLRAAAIRQA